MPGPAAVIAVDVGNSIGADAVVAGAAATGLALALDRIFERAATGAPALELAPPGLDAAAG